MTSTAKNMGNLIAARKKPQKINAPEAAKGTEVKMIAFRSTAAARKQLATLALDLDRSQQDLLIEALNYIFTKNNCNPIA